MATKVGQVQPRPGAWVLVGGPALLRHQYEMSLRRLGVGRSDLLYLHRMDPDVPFADQIGTMKELKNEGKIAHVGLSEAAVEQIEAARAIVDVAAVQNI
ncbi:aldo/keto reductase [Streptomyces sp. NPDC005506]|uniref:aldo/keto reductase n=1 Tax=Streptomyces sp. NPDC005506 TaxID=3364718 RepID=UPI003697F597